MTVKLDNDCGSCRLLLYSKCLNASAYTTDGLDGILYTIRLRHLQYDKAVKAELV